MLSNETINLSINFCFNKKLILNLSGSNFESKIKFQYFVNIFFDLLSLNLTNLLSKRPFKKNYLA